MIDIRTEIREAFAKEQSAFPPPAALQAQVVAELNSRARAVAPARPSAGRDWNWLLVAAAALLAIAIVAGLLAVRLTNLMPPPPVNTGPPPQRCVPGATPSSDRFARVHGCITYSDGLQIVAVDPYHPANAIVLGPSNGRLPIAWSRDGRRLVLVSCASACDFYVMNADGSEARLTNGDAAGWDKASFSRDGTKVVYDGYDAKAGSGTSGLYTVDVTGGSRRLIAASSFGTSSGDSSLADPAWSPDGSRIAYADYRNSASQSFGGDEIWIMNSDGTGQRRLVSVGQCRQNQIAGCTDGLSWSPDGSQLAFHSAGGIYLVRRDGSGLHRISTSGGQPIWSPDGSRIAFTRGGELFTMATDGSDVTLLEGVVVVPNYAWTWNRAG
ncbi:MAG TPA: hypothetical protein VF956_13110 [Candidatus Dormibacteraeota bacterium]